MMTGWGRPGRGGWRGGGRGRGRGAANASLDSSMDSSCTLESLNDLAPCPFPAWSSYLPDTPYSVGSPAAALLEPASAFLRASAHWVEQEELYTRRSFPLHLPELAGELPEAVALRAAWPGLQEEIEERAHYVLGIFGLARHTLASAGAPAGEPFPVVRARPVGLEPDTPLAGLRCDLFRRLVAVRGTVVRVAAAAPCCLWLAWSCPSCRAEVVVHQPGGRHTAPTRCRKGCRNTRNFTPLRSSRRTVCVDRQTIRLQEVMQLDDRLSEAGRVPRTVQCELTEDLCDTAVPGDVVRVTGIVKVLGVDGDAAKKKSKSVGDLIYLSAVSVCSPRGPASRTGTLGIDFTERDYAMVREVHGLGPGVLPLLVASLAPSIYGHELVKAGLLLGLAGGTVRSAGAALPVRADPHILVVGDPGLGKSQMLAAALAVAPRGVFVTGNTSTAGGLTVSLAREKGADFTLEAGALVLADRGCCCIDEFDKMSGQHQALLEAMEQQSVSVAKAGVVCSLPARTAILAAANPAGGHYNRAKTVAENLKLGPALLSRFDLVFILLDRRDREQDERLSSHVMALHSGGQRPRGRPAARAPALSQLAQTQGVGQLAERLAPRPGEPAVDPLPPSLLRKYLAYARRWVQPSLGARARAVLQDFYLQLRAKPQGEATPITTRQLESLIRLTEARARLELREEATEQDALEVVEIMRESMVDTFTDNIGGLDFSRSQMGAGMSSRGAAKKFIAACQRHSNMTGNAVFSLEELRQVATGGGVKVPSFRDFLDSLNHQGYFLKKSNNEYQLQPTDF